VQTAEWITPGPRVANVPDFINARHSTSLIWLWLEWRPDRKRQDRTCAVFDSDCLDTGHITRPASENESERQRAGIIPSKSESENNVLALDKWENFSSADVWMTWNSSEWITVIFIKLSETVSVSDNRLTLNDPRSRWRACTVPLYDVTLLWIIMSAMPIYHGHVK